MKAEVINRLPLFLVLRKKKNTHIHRRKDMDDLFRTIPEDVMLKEPLDIPKGISEQEVRRKIKGIAGKTRYILPFSEAAAHTTTTSPAVSDTLHQGRVSHYLPLTRQRFPKAYSGNI